MRKVKIRGVLSFVAVAWFLVGLVAIVRVASSAEHGGEPYIHPEGVYLVQDGDSLWVIAGRFLNNPYLWRKIWEENPFIGNPNLIFPGDPLIIPGLTGPTSPMAELPPLAEERVEAPEAPGPETMPPGGLEEPGELGEPGEVGEPGEFVGPGPEEFVGPGEEGLFPPSESEMEPVEVTGLIEPQEEELIVRPATIPNLIIPRPALECSGFVTEGDDVHPVGVIIRHAEEGEGEKFWYNDQIFVDLGGRKVERGDRFQIIRPTETVRHPVTGRRVGVKVRTLGTVEISSTAGVIPRAKIVYSCEDIIVGDYLVKVKRLPDPPKGLSQQTNLKLKGYIVASKDDADSLGMGDIVYVDVGRDENVVAGDEFGIYQTSGTGVSPISGRGIPLAPIKRGELVVIRTSANSAAALLTRTDRFLRVGKERIVLIRKMPK